MKMNHVFCTVYRSKSYYTCKHLVQDASQRPEITGKWRLGALHYFRSHVRHSTWSQQQQTDIKYPGFQKNLDFLKAQPIGSLGIQG